MIAAALRWTSGIWGSPRVHIFRSGGSQTFCGLMLGPEQGDIDPRTKTALGGIWLRTWGCTRCLSRARRSEIQRRKEAR